MEAAEIESDPILQTKLTETKEGQPEKKHPLFEKMDSAKQYIMKAPNMQFLIQGVRLGEWCLTKKACEKLAENFKNNIIMLFIVSVKGTNVYQAAARVQSPELRQITDDWLKIYPGQYQALIDVQWLSFAELPFSKT